ncbi:hypothetical protein A2U01_0069037, partial [Trifolium medium]|nr:hypothetical protein [Trifolium medium]
KGMRGGREDSDLRIQKLLRVDGPGSIDSHESCDDLKENIRFF